MNAPMPASPMAAAPQGPPGSYPAGADVAQTMAGQDGMVDNPVIAGFRSIMMFVKTLMDRGDPRGQAAAQHIAGLLQTLQGAPMDSPMPAPAPVQPGSEPPVLPGGPAPELPQGQGAGAASMPPTPSAPTLPPAPPAPEPAAPAGMAFNPFTAPKEEAAQGQKKQGGSKPMFAQQIPQGAKPVVLT